MQLKFSLVGVFTDRKWDHGKKQFNTKVNDTLMNLEYSFITFKMALVGEDTDHGPKEIRNKK